MLLQPAAAAGDCMGGDLQSEHSLLFQIHIGVSILEPN